MTNPREIPTKSNLTYAKNTLAFSQQGYALLEQKRKTLIRDAVALTEQAAALRARLGEARSQAYAALQAAHREMGGDAVARAGQAVPLESGVRVSFYSVMGVELPRAACENAAGHVPDMASTTAALDAALTRFNEVKALLVALAGTENAARRLAEQVKKTNKRANALHNITIPALEGRVKHMEDSLAERERDAFTRLKMIKSRYN